MKVGDLFITNSNSLYICVTVDLQNGTGFVSKIVDDKGQLIDPERNGQQVKFGDQRLSTVTYGSKEVTNIMQLRTFPVWALQVVTNASRLSAMASQAAQGAAQTLTKGYAIGTLILGSGKAGNVWIVNKDNTRDISMLWNGPQARWCGSELEFQDKIVKTRILATILEVIDFINKQLPPTQQLTHTNFPAWAWTMMFTTHQPLLPKQAPPTGMSPGVKKALDAMGVTAPIQQKKSVDSAQNKCEHVFKSYVGFREVYDFCTKCDVKIGTKQ